MLSRKVGSTVTHSLIVNDQLIGSSDNDFESFNSTFDPVTSAAMTATPSVYTVQGGETLAVPQPKTVVRRERKNVVAYTVDGNGFGSSVKGSLLEDFGEGVRSSAETRAQANAAARSLPTDHGGHLAAFRVMREQGELNLFPQNGNFNVSAFKTLENDYARYINDGFQVDFEHTLSDFDSVTGRPGKVYVDYNVLDANGNVIDSFSKPFANTAGQTYIRRKF